MSTMTRSVAWAMCHSWASCFILSRVCL